MGKLWYDPTQQLYNWKRIVEGEAVVWPYTTALYLEEDCRWGRRWNHAGCVHSSFWLDEGQFSGKHWLVIFLSSIIFRNSTIFSAIGNLNPIHIGVKHSLIVWRGGGGTLSLFWPIHCSIVCFKIFWIDTLGIFQE